MVEVSCRDAYLRLRSVAVVRDGQEILLEKGGLSERHCSGSPSSNPEAELCSALACLQTDHRPVDDTCLLECSEVALLNNSDYHLRFCSALAKLLTRMKETGQKPDLGSAAQSDSADPTGCADLHYVLDVSEGFSLLSLIAASQGHVKAFSSVEKIRQQEVLKRLAHANKIQLPHLEFWLNHMEDEQGMLQRPSTEKLWSAIILDCVETCGLIRQKLMQKASLAR